MSGYANIVATVVAEHAFKTAFDVMWDVSHHSTNECTCSMVHYIATSMKCTNNALGLTRAICVTLDLNLNLWHVIHQ